MTTAREDGVGTARAVDRVGEEESPPTGAASFTGGWTSRATPPPSYFPRSWAEDRSGREGEKAPRLSPNENNTAWSLAAGGSGGEGRPLQPSLAWEATEEGAKVHLSSDGRGEARRRVLPRGAPFAPPETAGFYDLGLSLAAFPPPATAPGNVRCAKRTSPSRRRHGRASARIGYRGSPRGTTSPDRSFARSGEERQQNQDPSAVPKAEKTPYLSSLRFMRHRASATNTRVKRVIESCIAIFLSCCFRPLQGVPRPCLRGESTQGVDSVLL